MDARFIPRRRRTQRTRGCRILRRRRSFGLTWLALILGVLFWQGFGGLSLRVFTEMTPAAGGGRRAAQRDRRQPDHDRDWRWLIGAPIGVLAGTYMAEYGTARPPDQRWSASSTTSCLARHRSWSACSSMRVMVRADGAFLRDCGRRGAGRARDSGDGAHDRRHVDAWCPIPCARRRPSIGLPRSLMIRQIAYRAARAGIITGLLLAVARISGETAPLLFTALNNQFFSHRSQRADGRVCRLSFSSSH